ncbi:MAG: hypothetical protein GAK31_03978 [Stenotrophomonas maltophilia]|uniref:Uncharacterized protein n=1 Tax=Stenotrophomonas maltophilia TaxID=40324 RepID=A0A7V8JK31_STEMA|nr:MAG: hypothetical protein GAK31_03978 [Stenotrophomonas maltophilia]
MPQLAQCAFAVQVRVAAQARAGQPRGIDQAGVVELVLYADIVFFGQQGLLHGQVGGEATAEQQRTRVAEPLGHVALQRLVQCVVAADQVRCAGADAFACGCILQCIDHAELLGQAQVIVAAEAGQPAPVQFQADTIAALHRAAGTVAALGIAQGTLGKQAGGQIGAGHGGFRRRRGG